MVFLNQKLQGKTALLLISLFTLLTACGGGSDGGSSTKSTAATSTSTTSSSSSAPSLIADAGEDLTVNQFAIITLNPHATVANPTSFSRRDSGLEIKGSSTNPQDIVNIKWTLVDGPATDLSTSSTTSAEASFTAPSTGNAPTIVTYKLNITNAAGQTAEDTVTFTVNHINSSPGVMTNAGDITVKGLDTVTIMATASDEDGTVAGYSWTQLAGPVVSLSASDSATITFTAPSTNSNLDISFKVEVTDNLGAIGLTYALVHVTPENPPRVALYFPPPFGVYKAATISAFGNVSAIGATVSSVNVDVGAEPIAATVNSDGSWRADNLTVPTDATSFTLQVTATDSLGRESITQSHLQTTGTSIGAGSGWFEPVGIAIDNETNTAYVLDNPNYDSTTLEISTNSRLFPISLETGDRGTVISDFDNTLQGTSFEELQHIVYDHANHLIYAIALPTTLPLSAQIISIDITNGQRNLISDSTHGSGSAIGYGAGLSLGVNGTLYVTNTSANNILAIDTATGNRSVVTNNITLINPIELAFDSAHNKLYASNSNIGIPINFFSLDLSANPVTSILVSYGTNTTKVGTGPVISSDAENLSGLFMDSALNQLFTINGSYVLFSIDTITGNRTQIAALSEDAKFTYDPQKHIIYAIEANLSNIRALSVIDPTTGQKVFISGTKF